MHNTIKQAGYFFKDCSDKIIEDEVLTELLAFHNVILTAHQAFFTQEAIDKIVSTTIDNIVEYMNGKHGRDHPNSIFT
jgi:D-lactate dehydrogenase